MADWRYIAMEKKERKRNRMEVLSSIIRWA